MSPPQDRAPRKRRGPRKATPEYLERAALYHLQRFATSAANLRALLMRKVERSARDHGTDREEAAGWVDGLIERYRRSGLLDDRAYATGRARSLRARGTAARGIRAKLRAKGVEAADIEAGLAAADEESGGEAAELRAAAAYARRRRIGPWRPEAARAAARERDLAALARNGFSYDVARRVVEADSPAALAAEVAEETA